MRNKIKQNTGRLAFLMLALVVGCAALLQSAGKQQGFTAQDKAYYADQATVDFVRPGLTITVKSVNIASDGTTTARITLTDPKGLPLDRDGITTPGTISTSFIAANIPSGATQYTAYTTRVQTSPITGVSATQAGSDTGGSYVKNADGDYTYTFGKKLASIDRHATHSIGVYGSRNLTEFDLGTNYASTVYTFVPDGSAVTTVRDVIKNSSCNRCHADVAFHGGSRRGMELCILCHTPQTVDPDTGNSVDMMIMTHRIHAGDTLPSVIAGKPYQIVGNAQRVSDWSTVAFPADIRRCETCHEQTTGAKQASNYLTKPTRAACGSCHDNVNFATGQNHLNLPQVSDSQCANCHQPQGELPLDASIKGAHTLIGPAAATRTIESTDVKGVVVDILKVDNGVAGKAPVVTFTLKDSKGTAIPIESMRTSPSRVALVMAGPTTDYGYTSFGADVTTGGYVSEDVTQLSKCDAGGTCTYTFTHVVPAAAKGTYAIGIEARRGETFLAGTAQAAAVEYGAINKVVYFSVDGSTVAPRRTVVDIAKCNSCHGFLTLHGTNRNQIEQCVLCHNPSETDAARRVSAPAAEKARPNQTVQFAYMIHRIHTGEALAEDGADYTVIGFGGSVNDFSEVRYPVFTNTGGVGNTARCSMCHVNGSEGVLPTGKKDVLNPQGLLNPTPAISAACLGCHAGIPAASHALANTTKLGESCAACHGPNADFSVAEAHAN
jgi:OmcA/MtrC family decaheme c-type cytochrome